MSDSLKEIIARCRQAEGLKQDELKKMLRTLAYEQMQTEAMVRLMVPTVGQIGDYLVWLQQERIALDERLGISNAAK